MFYRLQSYCFGFILIILHTKIKGKSFQYYLLHWFNNIQNIQNANYFIRLLADFSWFKCNCFCKNFFSSFCAPESRIYSKFHWNETDFVENYFAFCIYDRFERFYRNAICARIYTPIEPIEHIKRKYVEMQNVFDRFGFLFRLLYSVIRSV